MQNSIYLRSWQKNLAQQHARNTMMFFQSKMLMRTRRDITLHVYCLSRQMKSPFDYNLAIETKYSHKVTGHYSPHEHNREVIPICTLSLT
jgi:hypothetical protein